jgi:hypothetical protein
MHEAGFVDIDVRDVKMKCGAWVESDVVDTDRSESKTAYREARTFWMEEVTALVELAMKEVYFREGGSEEFATKVKADIGNELYHLYSPMYIYVILPLMCRICVMGRRPPEFHLP